MGTLGRVVVLPLRSSQYACKCVNHRLAHLVDPGVSRGSPPEETPEPVLHNLRRLVDPGMIRGSPPEPTPEPVLHSLRRLEGELAVQSPLTVLPLDRPCNVCKVGRSFPNATARGESRGKLPLPATPEESPSHTGCLVLRQVATPALRVLRQAESSQACRPTPQVHHSQLIENRPAPG